MPGVCLTLPSSDHVWNNVFTRCGYIGKGKEEWHVSYLKSEAMDSEPRCRFSKVECCDRLVGSAMGETLRRAVCMPCTCHVSLAWRHLKKENVIE